jgi:hypothetical protein
MLIPEIIVPVICLVGILICRILVRRLSAGVVYRDQEGDAVSPRSVCRSVTLIFAIILVAMVVRFFSLDPSHERRWQPGLDRLPAATFTGNTARIENVRNFRINDDGTRRQRWETRTYDLDQLESVWYILSVFNGEGWRGPAHGMLSFGFRDGRFLVVSVEARKEVGESYSIWKGMFRRFEMMYVLGDERDLLLERCAHRPDVVHMYPVTASPEQVRRLLEDFLNAANDLQTRPRFYNTLTFNCTSRLRDHVNRVFPGRVPPTWKVILPGYSDELIRDLDLLDFDGSLEEARETYRIDIKASVIGDVPEFSRLIRQR